MDIDPSIRSAGMGGASNAVRWGHGSIHWSNPSLLDRRGLSYEFGFTQLVPSSRATSPSGARDQGRRGAPLCDLWKAFGGGIDLSYGLS